MAGQVMGWGRSLLNKSVVTLEVAPGWGFIKSFGNRVKRMPETDHPGKVMWLSIRSRNCFRFQGCWLLSQALPAEC